MDANRRTDAQHATDSVESGHARVKYPSPDAAQNGSHIALARKLNTASRLLHVVCHPVRLQILLALADGDRDVFRLEAESGHLGFRLLSPHLCKLRKTALVKRWSLGGPPVYSLTATGHEIVRISRSIDALVDGRESDGTGTAQAPELRLATPLVSHPIRFRILCLLGERERETRQLCEALGDLRLPAVSQHLSVLRDGRLVRSRRQGKRNVYTLTEAGLRVLKEHDRTA